MNRRATSHRSHLALIPLDKLFSDRDGILFYNAKSSFAFTEPSGDPLENALTDPLVVSRPQRRPGPDDLHWKIPPAEWPSVLRRIDQGETLRQVALDYGVSYEAVRRVIRAAHKPGIGS